jgi:hypothetical protein
MVPVSAPKEVRRERMAWICVCERPEADGGAAVVGAAGGVVVVVVEMVGTDTGGGMYGEPLPPRMVVLVHETVTFMVPESV